jgi:hypothetical protein
MNYYIVTKEVFETIEPGTIQFAHHSMDNSAWVVTTTDTVENVLSSYTNASDLSSYTVETNTHWTGDGSGIEEWEIEETEYLSGI